MRKLTAGEALRCVTYCRYSTHMQRPASLEDQERSCRDYAAERGWLVLDEPIYQDAARTGTTILQRDGYDRLKQAMKLRPQPFDCVLIDDTSRLGRDLSELLKFYKFAKHHGVRIVFVSQKLDSNDENFSLLLTLYGQMDEQHVERLSRRVRQSHRGRREAGYRVGSIPHGYRGRRVLAPGVVNGHGQAATLGTLLEIDELEAAHVIRAFQAFADATSIHRIAKDFNAEVAETNARKWDDSAIKRMLRNELYRGVEVVNRSRSSRDPETNKAYKEPLPAEKHVRYERPHLRIIPEELWDKVQARLAEYEDKQEGRRKGGYHRAKHGPYLYSSLLICGGCGKPLTIDGVGKHISYSCRNQRLNRGCTNKYRIRQDRATEHITRAIVQQLSQRENINHLVKAVLAAVAQERLMADKQSAGITRSDLEAALRDVNRKIQTLVDAIEESPDSEIKARLQQRKLERAKLTEQLKRFTDGSANEMTESEIRALIEANIENLLEVLRGDPTLARDVIQRHIRPMTLFPDFENGKREFHLVCEGIDLISMDRDGNSGVLLGRSCTGADQQHTGILRSFTAVLDAGEDAECDLVEPLLRMLDAQPELSAGLRTLQAWAELLTPYLEPGRPAIRWPDLRHCVTHHQEFLRGKVNVTAQQVPPRPGNMYGFSLAGDTVDSPTMAPGPSTAELAYLSPASA